MTTSVTVLLALYNGADHLAEQLTSLKAQTLGPRRIVASDDGSSDDTKTIFLRFMEAWPDCEAVLLDGPGSGSDGNFLKLLRQPSESEFVALCDQDDVWLPDKLERAARSLSEVERKPALYGSRTTVCDADLRPMYLSRLMRPPFDFRHALVQNFAGGNTQVLNKEAFKIVRELALKVEGISAHDLWLYQVISAVGGTVMFDAEPTLLYRQHGGSVLGDARRPSAMKNRAALVRNGTYQQWITTNLATLDLIEDQLSPQTIDVMSKFRAARDGGLLRRLFLILRAGLRRHGTLGQLALYWAAANGKL